MVDDESQTQKALLLADKISIHKKEGITVIESRCHEQIGILQAHKWIMRPNDRSHLHRRSQSMIPNHSGTRVSVSIDINVLSAEVAGVTRLVEALIQEKKIDHAVAV